MSISTQTAPVTKNKFYSLPWAQRKARLRRAVKKYTNDPADMELELSEHSSDDGDIDYDWLEDVKRDAPVVPPSGVKQATPVKVTKKEPQKNAKRDEVQTKSVSAVIPNTSKNTSVNGKDERSPAKIGNRTALWETKAVESHKPVTSKGVDVEDIHNKVDEAKAVFAPSRTTPVKQRGRIPFDMGGQTAAEKEASEPRKVGSMLSMWENKKAEQQNGFDAIQDGAFTTKTMGRLKGAKALFENISKTGSVPSRSFKIRPDSPKTSAAPVNDVRNIFENKAKKEEIQRSPSIKRIKQSTVPSSDTSDNLATTSPAKSPVKSPVKPPPKSPEKQPLRSPVKPRIPAKPPLLSPKSTQSPRQYSETDSLDGIFSNEDLSDVSSLSLSSSSDNEDEDAKPKKLVNGRNAVRKQRAEERKENSEKEAKEVVLQGASEVEEQEKCVSDAAENTDNEEGNLNQQANEEILSQGADKFEELTTSVSDEEDTPDNREANSDVDAKNEITLKPQIEVEDDEEDPAAVAEESNKEEDANSNTEEKDEMISQNRDENESSEVVEEEEHASEPEHVAEKKKTKSEEDSESERSKDDNDQAQGDQEDLVPDVEHDDEEEQTTSNQEKKHETSLLDGELTPSREHRNETVSDTEDAPQGEEEQEEKHYQEEVEEERSVQGTDKAESEEDQVECVSDVEMTPEDDEEPRSDVEEMKETKERPSLDVESTQSAEDPNGNVSNVEDDASEEEKVQKEKISNEKVEEERSVEDTDKSGPDEDQEKCISDVEMTPEDKEASSDAEVNERCLETNEESKSLEDQGEQESGVVVDHQEPKSEEHKEEED